MYKRQEDEEAAGWEAVGSCAAVCLMAVSYTHLDVYKRQVDDIVRVGDGEVQPEEPDEVDHPVQLIPKVGPCAKKSSFHGDLLVFYHTMIHFITPVSYTHLDVYKRQQKGRSGGVQCL